MRRAFGVRRSACGVSLLSTLCVVVGAGLFFFTLLAAGGCVSRGGRQAVRVEQVPAVRVDEASAPEPRRPLAPQAPQRPTLDKEPQVGILLAQAADVSLDLLSVADITIDGQVRRIAAGPLIATATSRGIRLDRLPGVELGDHLLFQCASSARGITFTATALAPNGSSDDLQLTGSPEIHLDPASRKLQLVERIGMDTYLVGIVAKEMSPTWPLEALKAQAIVARSYAADRFLQNWQRPWQLHWHSSVDMAYPGYVANPGQAGEAVAATAGMILTYHGQPVPALFHACSGGRTACITDLKPELTLADGTTDPAPAMPSVEDPAAQQGAQKLNLSRTHWQWSASIPLSEASAAVQRWSQVKYPTKPEVGDVTGVRIVGTGSDGHRVTTVVVAHRVAGHTVKTEFNANDLRLALGPGKIRSTWWTSCEVKKGNLCISGRGYGHGVGLSQVSAWQLAETGVRAPDIVRCFYAGSTLVTAW